MSAPFSFTPVTPDILSWIGIHTTPLLEPTDAIYTNRDLDLAQIEMVGFDMDYTLAVYKKFPMEQLQYRLSAELLVREYGYPADILHLPYDPHLTIRGLLIDKSLGILFKMDVHSRVWRAMQGRRQLSAEEIQAQYANTKIAMGSPRFASLDTLFAIPEACLYCNLLDYFEGCFARGVSIKPLENDSKESAVHGPIHTWKLFDDVRNATDKIHADGSLKSIITQNLSDYIYSNPDTALTLHKLRSTGKKLFLLTNSHWEYTNAVMHYLLDEHLKEYPHWRSYFDIIVVDSHKPDFFKNSTPFTEIDVSKHVYAQGNIADFERMVGCGGERILYVGDHIYGDILRSKKDSLWRTCLIVEELPQEIQYAIRWARDIDLIFDLDADRQDIDAAIGQNRALLTHIETALLALKNAPIDEEKDHELQIVLKRLRREIDAAKRVLRKLDQQVFVAQDELERRFHPIWGRLTRERNELSRFGAQVTSFACIYTGNVANFLLYSPVQTFRATSDMMSHDRILMNTREVRQARVHPSQQ